MRRGILSRVSRPKMEISIEWEDEDYIYISSHYPYQKLQKDVETLKVPIIIRFD